jgi:hypothetical protein
VKECERLVELEDRLPAVLRGEVQPAGTAERLEYAFLGRVKGFNRAATGFYAEAFTAEPLLADERKAGHRFHAACAAVLAAAGQGEDANKPDDAERVRLRWQALDWLRADLTAQTKDAQGEEKARPALRRTLHRWRLYPDLVTVRDPDALANLTEDERQAWQQLWAEVDALLRKAEAQE